MPNDVMEILQNANGPIFFWGEDGTHQTLIHEAMPVAERADTITVEEDLPFAELPNEREFAVASEDDDWITGIHEAARVYAANPRREAGAGFYYEDDLPEETELMCSYVGIRGDADFLGHADRNNRVHNECCIIVQTGELVCYMDGKLTAWSRDDYRIEHETMQIHGGPHNVVLGETVCAVHVFVRPDASYPYGSAGCCRELIDLIHKNNADDAVIADAFDEVYA